MSVTAASSLVDKPPVTQFGATLIMAPRVVKVARAIGLINGARPASRAISFSPPFIIMAGKIDDMVVPTRAAVDARMNEMLRDGVGADAA